MSKSDGNEAFQSKWWNGADFYIMPRVIPQQWGRYIGSDGVAIYAAIASYANTKTGAAWPSHKTLAESLDLSIKTVSQTIADLEAVGLLTVERKYDDSGKFLHNVYTLTQPHEPTADPGTSPRAKREQERKAKRASVSSLEKSISWQASNSYMPGQVTDTDKASNSLLGGQVTVTPELELVLELDSLELEMRGRQKTPPRPAPSPWPYTPEEDARMTEAKERADIENWELAKQEAAGIPPSRQEQPKSSDLRIPEESTIPPAAPVTWEDVEAAPASARGYVAPTGKSKDAIERALTLACVPGGNRRLIKSLEGEIRRYAKVIREGDLASAEDIMTRCVGEDALFYTTYLAEDAEGGLTTPPTPGSIAKWLWNLENMRSKRWEGRRAYKVVTYAPSPPEPEMVDDIRKLTVEERRNRRLAEQARYRQEMGLYATA